MLKKLFGVWLVCAACITAVPVCAAETGFAVTVGAEKESTATFEKDKTFSGTAENGDVVTISVYTENYRGNRVLRSSTEIEVGASGLFSQSVGLRLGENRVEISCGDEVYTVLVRRYAQALKKELESGISLPGSDWEGVLR